MKETITFGFAPLIFLANVLMSSAQEQKPDKPWLLTIDQVNSIVTAVRAGKDLTPSIWPEGAKVAVGRHEIGLHGWIHERNSLLTEAEERELMTKSFERLKRMTGKAPVGIRTPSWDFSAHTLKLIRELGLLYDSSLMADDRPYEILEHGKPTGVVELPVEWLLDDYPYFGFDRYTSVRPHIPPSGVLEIWAAEFDKAYEEGTLFVLTMHPKYIGHRSRILMLERLIQHMLARQNVWFATHEQIARYVKTERPD